MTIAQATLAANAIENLFRRHLENPFFVLGLPPAATAGEIERQGQKWLSMLAADIAEARTAVTPFGAVARTPELVRAAMAELADPARRLGHEWWARGASASVSASPSAAVDGKPR